MEQICGDLTSDKNVEQSVFKLESVVKLESVTSYVNVLVEPLCRIREEIDFHVPYFSFLFSTEQKTVSGYR